MSKFITDLRYYIITLVIKDYVNNLILKNVWIDYVVPKNLHFHYLVHKNKELQHVILSIMSFLFSYTNFSCPVKYPVDMLNVDGF